MKKKYLIIGLIDLIIITIGIILVNKHHPKQVIKSQELYLMNYTASYSTYDVLNNVNKYEIVRNLMDLNIILGRAKDNNYDNRYNNSFFEEKALLVIEGLIDSKINNMMFKMFRASIDVYTATPLTDSEKEYEFDLYMIPIEQSITHVELNISPYPDRMY